MATNVRLDCIQNGKSLLKVSFEPVQISAILQGSSRTSEAILNAITGYCLMLRSRREETTSIVLRSIEVRMTLIAEKLRNHFSKKSIGADCRLSYSPSHCNEKENCRK